MHNNGQLPSGIFIKKNQNQNKYKLKTERTHILSFYEQLSSHEP